MNIHLRLGCFSGQLSRGQRCYRNFLAVSKQANFERTLPSYRRAINGLCPCSNVPQGQILARFNSRKNILSITLSRLFSTKSPVSKANKQIKSTHKKIQKQDLKKLFELAWPERWKLGGKILFMGTLV